MFRYMLPEVQVRPKEGQKSPIDYKRFKKFSVYVTVR